MQKTITSCKRKKELIIKKISFAILILTLLAISPAAASVSNWELSSENPALGDTLSIEGSASPGEKIDVLVNFAQTIPVSEGEYEYILEGVEIPSGFDNRFTVQATGSKNLNIRVKMIIWVTKSADASGNTATVSQSSVPPGTYRIKIDGDAAEGASTVDLKITALQGIEADSEGDFSYSYSTKAVPPGDFEINVGGITKTVTLTSENASEGDSSSSPPEIETKTAPSKFKMSHIVGGFGVLIIILIMYSRRK
ncbi:hypothetical protein [Methanosarcina sp. 1.H.A.2.2]|uniref:hypothetical protein n=1 Tax=Methanosarcina sp. 1.H.A.2.2 TaxID=1483601 RepID=UPI0006224011|nr:hypothetical protein [Methanosarcina sp. 1.H.A.2.2]KKH47194.1 hypothetical protein EO93_06120 [Methanosarcina sp. 1.H.A.2.2]